MNDPEAPSSVSDSAHYRSACAAAASDPALFRVFRKTPPIIGIIEPFIPHDRPERRFVMSSEELLGWLIREPDFLDQYPSFQLNDTIGEPYLEAVPGLSDMSIYTLRYIKIAYDLRRLFGSLDDLDIIEIGGGYGGQCAILSRLFKWSSYTIIDLPEVSQLQRRYLGTLGVENVTFVTLEELNAEQRYDLVISNYAYSELSAELRAFYLDRVLAKSTHGYMLWNYLVMAYNRNGGGLPISLNEEVQVFAKILERIPGLRFADHLLLSNDIEFRGHLAVWGID
jgi:hypothetical protein